METEYAVFLGECSPKDRSLNRKQSREEYLAHQALRYTLIRALDVTGFRSFIGLPNEDIRDEEVLYKLHKLRAECSFVPVEACTESILWLRANQSRLEAVPEKRRA